jgi:error-prone DNA polymerase
MSYCRDRMTALGVRRAVDLGKIQNGKIVRIAGCVIARQRPGTANGFVFLSLEDETGIANAILTPDIFRQYRQTIIDGRFLLLDGRLQNVDNVVSVKVSGGENHRCDSGDCGVARFSLEGRNCEIGQL